MKKRNITLFTAIAAAAAFASSAQAAIVLLDGTASTAGPSTDTANFPASRVTDGVGMSGEGTLGLQNNNSALDSWYSIASTEWFRVDLGATVAVGEMYVWNGQTGGISDRGTGSSDIYYSLTDTAQAIPTGGASDGDWIFLKNESAWNQGTNDGTPYGPTDTFDLDVTARVIGFQLTEGFGGNGGNSIAAMQFEVVPEPATMSLLALGGLALLRRRRA